MRSLGKIKFKSANESSNTIGFGTSSAPLKISNGQPAELDLVIVASNNAGMTVTVQKGDATGANFIPVQVKNDDTDAAINGSTGIALTANTTTRYRINTNITSQLRLDLAGSAGSITAYIEGAVYDN